MNHGSTHTHPPPHPFRGPTSSLTHDIMLHMRKSIYTNTQIQRRLLQSKEVLINERKRRLARSTTVSFQLIKSTSV